jgi:hypothetical protein
LHVVVRINADAAAGPGFDATASTSTDPPAQGLGRTGEGDLHLHVSSPTINGRPSNYVTDLAELPLTECPGGPPCEVAFDVTLEWTAASPNATRHVAVIVSVFASWKTDPAPPNSDVTIRIEGP